MILITFAITFAVTVAFATFAFGILATDYLLELI